MLRTILSRLEAPSSCYLFGIHYARLMEAKGSQEWNYYIPKIKRSELRKPFVKHYFDSLENKYNYTEYMDKISNDKDFRTFEVIYGYNQIEEEKELIRQLLELYFITETYIGFMVEYLIAEELKNKGIKVYQNNVLDIQYKTDLLFKGKHFQIKNYSFLETFLIESKLEPYIKANKKLNFLFYKISVENISLVKIGGKAFLKAQEINDFTQLMNEEEMSIDEFIDRV